MRGCCSWPMGDEASGQCKLLGMEVEGGRTTRWLCRGWRGLSLLCARNKATTSLQTHGLTKCSYLGWSVGRLHSNTNHLYAPPVPALPVEPSLNPCSEPSIPQPRHAASPLT